ncbi:MAG: hypothetical protein EPO64_11045 [Nitrospirae bacterium]|nr:MAG: hypothetical protein EPO64_11045 [Nitrospirota bacterium]
MAAHARSGALREAAGLLKRVGIFTATRWELDAVCRAVRVEEKRRIAGARCLVGLRGNCRIYAFQTGVGAAKAGAVCREVLAQHPLDLALSCGFACALAPSRIGDLLIGTDVTVQEDGVSSLGQAAVPSGAVPCAEPFREVAIAAAQKAGLAAHVGRFVTVPRVLWRADEKRRAALSTGAIGLDMESAAMGAAAVARQVPFLVVRAASDLLDEDLPLDFNLFLAPPGPRGFAGWLRGAGFCLVHPSAVVGLNRLRRQSAVASERMTRFVERFLDDLQ